MPSSAPATYSKPLGGGSNFASRSSTPEPKRTRQRPRLLNLSKLFPISRSQLPSSGVTTPFRQIHTPDRPGQLTPASEAPSEEECRDFFLAFRSPKKYGFFDDEPTSPESERFGGIDKSLWRPWPLASTPSSAPVVEADLTSPKLVTTPSTAVSFRSESPLLEEARIVRSNSTATARLVNVDRGHSHKPSISRSPAVEAEEEQPRKNSWVTTLQEAQQRSSLLASHRLAARVSDDMRDSGYKSWRESMQKQVHQRRSAIHGPSALVGADNDQDDEENKYEASSPRSASSHRSWESGSRVGSIGHIAHILTPIGEDTEHTDPSSITDYDDDSNRSPGLEVPSNHYVRPESVCSRFRHWQTPEQRKQFEDDIEIYGDWAEYYFETPTAEPDSSSHYSSSGDEQDERSIRTASSDTQARRESVVEDPDSISPKTVRFEADDYVDCFNGIVQEQNDRDSLNEPLSEDAPVVPSNDREPGQQDEGSAHAPRRDLMRPPGLRFRHETDQEALRLQEKVLSTPWVRPTVKKMRRSGAYYEVVGNTIMNRGPAVPGTFGGQF